MQRLKCLFLYFILFVPSVVLAEVEPGTYTVSEMGSEVYWKAYLPSKTLYGRVMTKPVEVGLQTKQSTSVKNKPSMFSPITIKGTLEFDLASVAVLSEEDPVESVSWTNTLKSDEYLAVSIFPSLSFEIQSITQKEDPSFQETNNSIIEGSLVTFGQKVPISIPAILGIGGGYIMVTADFELPKDCFTYNKDISGNAEKDIGKKPIGQKLSGQKILIRLKLRAIKKHP